LLFLRDLVHGKEEEIIMNKQIFNIIKKYSDQPNDKETRDLMIRELGNELLISAPSFNGTLVDSTSLLEETQGKINIQIKYNDQLYNMNQFKKLAGI